MSSCGTLLLGLALSLVVVVTGTGSDVTVQQLHEELSRLTRRVEAAEAESALLRQELAAVKQDVHRRQMPFPEEVGFTAEVSKHLTSLSPQEIVVFDQIVSNIGNGYDPTTGRFTAPVPGTYMFFSNVMSEVQPGTVTFIETEIVTGNGTQIAEMYSGSHSAFDSTSNMGIVRLNKGDQVWVRVHGTWSNNFSIHCCFTSFTGYLLWLDEGRLEIVG